MYWHFLLLKLLAMCILCTISFEAWGSVPCTSDNSQICKYIFFLHHVEGTGIITSKLHQNTTFQHPAKLLNPSRHSIWILHTTTRHSEFYSTHIFWLHGSRAVYAVLYELSYVCVPVRYEICSLFASICFEANPWIIICRQPHRPFHIFLRWTGQRS